ncbi:probable phytol kinase 1, chloroplastic isoform X1 [Amaranthus tricolor]|uniref:probable phytol kinase 1, chloroplastic isoform X1 n=1 Tax=Amaranthus tricolor TaxID=29722 RepID=UPI002588FFF1|nr:probable phytol kinase 1, chloroplastic isoform X1 [Amaranthus tricolor]
MSFLTKPADTLASVNLKSINHLPISKPTFSYFLYPKTPINVIVTIPRCTLSTHAFLSPDSAVFQDVGATAFVLGGGYALVSTFDHLTNRNIISKNSELVSFISTQFVFAGAKIDAFMEYEDNFFVIRNLSRKLVHIISGLLFVASWPLFSTSIQARYFASVAPLTNCLRLVVHGLSLATDDSLIKSVTREGKPEELLRGPLYYVLILALCAIVFWRDSPIGLLSVAMMSGGDGVADIIGRKFGTLKIPYNPKKSWAGSISMFSFGFLVSIGMLYYFSTLGYFQLDWSITAKRVAIVSFIATLVESLPIAELIDDNISVPLMTLATACILFSL